MFVYTELKPSMYVYVKYIFIMHIIFMYFQPLRMWTLSEICYTKPITALFISDTDGRTYVYIIEGLKCG